MIQSLNNPDLLTKIVLQKLEIKSNDSENDQLALSKPVSKGSIGPKENQRSRRQSGEATSEKHLDYHKDEDEDESFLSSSKHLPFIEYKGRVEYCTELHDIAIASDTLT